MADDIVLTREGFEALIAQLRADGRRTIGPRVRDGAIVYDDVESAADLPVGVGEVAAPGAYRLVARADDALFGYAVGPHSWKRHLHAPHQRLWRTAADDGRLRVIAEPPSQERVAFIGARACELAAIAIQDRVLLDSGCVDPHYGARRSNAFIVAVECGVAGGGCFCASMGTGPEATQGFDVALAELAIDGAHVYLARAGTEAGRALLDRLPHRAAQEDERAARRAMLARTNQEMRRSMPAGARDVLARNADHPRWLEVAERCLSCANCTMVCPTCFCTTTEETRTLDGAQSGRSRRWDSCFTLDFSYVHGGAVRSSGAARYRQWITHKLSSWFDQFGGSGCVGCGRCIVWCPVGIDITEEVRAIAATESREEGAHGNA